MELNSVRGRGIDGERVAVIRQDLDLIERELAALNCLPTTANAVPADTGRQGLVGRQYGGGRTYAPTTGLVGRKASGNKPHTRTDVEGFVGRAVMGVLSALLVFIGMGVFGFLVMPFLPVGGRMAVLYAISILITAAGAWLLAAGKSRAVAFTALGIGAGAIYVSILFSDAVWLQGSVVTYVLLAGWLAGVCVCGRKMGGPFAAIGHVGIAVSAIMRFMQHDIWADVTGLTVLVLMLVAAEAVYAIIFRDRPGSVMSLAGMSVVGWSCQAAEHLYSDTVYSPYPNSFFPFRGDVCDTWGPLFLLGAGVFILIVFQLYLERGRGHGSILTDLALFAASVSMSGLFSCDAWVPLLFVYIAAILFSYSSPHGDSFRAYPYTMMIAVYFGMAGSLPWLVCVIPLLGLALAVLHKVPAVEYLSVGLLFLSPVGFLLDVRSETGWMPLSYAVVMAAVAAVLVLVMNRHVGRDRLLGALIYMFQGLAMFCFGYQLVDSVVCGLFPGLSGEVRYLLPWLTGCVCLLGVNTWVSRDVSAGHMRLAGWLLNGFVMWCSTGLMFELSDAPVLHMLAIVLAVPAFVSTARRQLESMYGGWWVGAKFAFLCWAVLDSFGAPGFAVSIGFLLLAAAAIAVGLRIRNRSLRLFGLLLSCISVFKLVLVDVSYESSLLKAGGFILCGAICFVISAVYGRVSRDSDGSSDTPD